MIKKRNVYWRVLLISLVVVISACGETITEKQHVERAMQAITVGDTKTGIIELKNALQKNPKNIEARYELGRLYLDKGFGSAAEKELKKALELGVDKNAVLFKLAKAYRFQAKNKEIIDLLAKETQIPNQKQAIRHAVLGNAYLNMRNFDEAEKHIALAVELNENDEDVGLGKSYLELAKGNRETGREWLNKTLENHKESARAWSLLGDLEQAEGMIDEAETAYTKAILLREYNSSDYMKRTFLRIAKEDYAGAKKDLKILKKKGKGQAAVPYADGLILYSDKEYVKAQAAFERTLKINANYMPAVLYLGLTQYVQNNFEQAESLLRRYSRAFPAVDFSKLVLGTILYKQGQHEEATSLALSVYQKDKKNEMALALLGNLSLAKGDSEAGVAYFEKLLEINPKQASARAKLGMGLLAIGEQARGERQLKESVELAPGMQQADITLILHYLQTKQYGEALKSINEFSAKNPNNVLTHNFLAGVYLGQGNEAKAVEEYEKALKLDDGDPLTRTNMAKIALRNNNIKQAKSHYFAIIEKDAGNVKALVALASLEQQTGNFPKAIDYYNKALNLSPKSLPITISLANLYMQVRKPVLALDVLGAAKINYPKAVAVLSALGGLQVKLSMYFEALLNIEEVVKLKPKSSSARYLLSTVYDGVGDVKSMRDELEKALKLDPSHLKAGVAMVRVYIAENKLGKASKMLEKLKAAHPRSKLTFRIEEGRIAAKAQKFDEAEVIFEEVLAEQATTGVTSLLAKVKFSKGAFEQGVSVYEEWLTDHPEDVKILSEFGELLMVTQQGSKAISIFDRLIKLAPNHVVTLNNLAWLYKDKNSTLALTYAEKALAILPRAPQLMDTMGMVLFAQGSHKKALRILTDASNLAKTDLSIKYHLALVMSKIGKKSQAVDVLKEIESSKRKFSERKEAEMLLKKLSG